MKVQNIPKKLIGSEDDRAVSPVIGVILMVAITVILAAVIAAFVLDIGPGDPDPNAAVAVNNQTDAVSVELTSTDDNTDGVALVAEDDLTDYDGGSGENVSDGDVLFHLDTSGAEDSISNIEVDGSDEEADFTVRSYSGSVEDGESFEEDIDGQSIEESITLEEED